MNNESTSTTRSIEINGPVERVFAFLAEPVKSVRALPMGRNVTVSDIATSPQGTLASYRETIPMRLGPVPWDMRNTVTVETVSTRIPLLDKVKVLVFMQSRGQARNMDMVLARVKEQVEAET